MSLGDPKVPLIGSEMGDKEANVYESGMGLLIESGKISRISGWEEIIDEYAP